MHVFRGLSRSWEPRHNHMGGKLVRSLPMICKIIADCDRSKPKEWLVEVGYGQYDGEILQDLILARFKPISRTIKSTLRRRCRCTSNHERSRCWIVLERRMLWWKWRMLAYDHALDDVVW
jgi:hypothetical protein